MLHAFDYVVGVYLCFVGSRLAIDELVAFAVAGERITHIWAVRNPEKLRAWTGAAR